MQLVAAIWKVALLALGLAGGTVFKLYTQTDNALDTHPIKILTSVPELDEYLYRYEAQLGNDMEAYRNHCQRVLTYAMHFLGGKDGLDPATYASHLRLLGAALAYHDLGLWSDSRMDYLEPSIQRAQTDLREDGFSRDDLQVIVDIIEYHHKLSPFQAPDSHIKDHVALVEAVRRGDAVDFTLGLVSMGMPRKHIQAVSRAIPEAGFHVLLTQFGYRLYKWDLRRHLDVLTVFKK